MSDDKVIDLLTENPVYKPFRYPWAYEAWLTQQQIHWLPEEVPLADDVKDWNHTISDAERNLLTQIFRFSLSRISRSITAICAIIRAYSNQPKSR